MWFVCIGNLNVTNHQKIKGFGKNLLSRHNFSSFCFHVENAFSRNTVFRNKMKSLVRGEFWQQPADKEGVLGVKIEMRHFR